MTERERQILQSTCDQLIASHQTLLLATRSIDGKPDISYAPFVRDEENFYIFVSELAKHTKNLMTYPHASILFIQAESEANNPFARQRLTLECSATEILKNDPLHNRQLNAMAKKFGEIVGLLRTLPDFHLLALRPHRGQFVAGFGKAFAVDANGRLQWPTADD
ncbi:HugZ family pyridoxamine 5'-phosphate oxidase [Methylomonas sp. MgM2]